MRRNSKVILFMAIFWAGGLVYLVKNGDKSPNKQVRPILGYFTIRYRPGQPNWEHTMWKFQDIFATQIVREINSGDFTVPKSAILTI